jgi:hypothetical protein
MVKRVTMVKWAMGRRPACRLWQATVLTCLTSLSFPTPAAAQQLEMPEYQAKALFLYHFAQLCEWPASAFATPDSPILIGVLGEDPFGRFLEDAVKGKSIGGRKLVIERSRRLEDVEDCHLVFVSASEKERVPRIVAALGRKPALTVSDIDGFAERGGVIRLFQQDDQPRFAINPVAAERAGLTLSSRLLRLATIVRPLEDGGG